MKSIIFTCVAAATVFFTAEHSMAQDGPKTRQVMTGDPYQNVPAYFSPRLGARFMMQTVSINGYPPVRAARIVSHPDHGSPLRQMGLGMGDVITRLDGVPVTSLAELERHALDTTVRYIDSETRTVQQDTIMIDPYEFFQDPLGHHHHAVGQSHAGLAP